MSEKVSLARIYYPVKVLGPGNRVGIWLNGCQKNCPGCISPEMRRYDPQKTIMVDDIIRMISRITDPIEGFTISGGEPFYKPKALNALVSALTEICDDILVFTGYTLEELRTRNDCEVQSVLDHCAAIVDGPFIRERGEKTGLRGSSNQRLWVFKYPERYAGMESARRSLQTIVYDKGVLTIGIPYGE